MFKYVSRFVLSLTLLLLSLPAWAQNPGNQTIPSSSGGGITQVSSLPALPCTNNAQSNLTTNTAQGQGLYTCINGAWAHAAPDDGVIHAQAFGAQGKIQVETSGANFTVTSGSNIVSSTTMHFLTSTFHVCQVGDILWATNWNGGDVNYVSSVAVIGLGSSTAVTVTSCDSDTQVHISANAGGNAGTTNGNVGVLIYGPDDQTANHLAKVAAYDNTITGCKVLKFAGPFTNMDLPDFNTAACEGVSGGSTLSKYTGMTGDNPSGNTTVALPPWLGLGSLAGCNGGLSGIACFGGAGGMSNVTWNGFGQSSFALGAHNIIESANDTSYFNVYGWGFAANSNFSFGVIINPGLHIGINIIADGFGQTPCGIGPTAGDISHIFSLECYNGTPTGTSGLLHVTSNFTCMTCVFGTSPTTGIEVDVSGAGVTYWDYGGYYTTPFTGTCIFTSTGIIHADGVFCPNDGGSASANAISVQGAGIATVRNSRLGSGATGGIFNCVASAACIDQGGNIYDNTQIQVGASAIIGQALSANKTPVTAAKLVLSAGWGTTAAVTAPTGANAPIQFTVTNSGTGQGASPTITYTFPVAYAQSPLSCSALQTGGTNATGTFTSSALSSTGVTFTFSLTPTATSTEIIQVTCVTT